MKAKSLLLVVLLLNFSSPEIYAHISGGNSDPGGVSLMLIPPAIQLQAPILQDTVYETGPFEIKASVSDPDGVAYVRIVYNVVGGLPDTVDMAITTGNIYAGIIPGHSYNTTIHYKIIASDLLANTTQTVTYTVYLRKDPWRYATIGTGLSTSNGGGPIFVSSATPIPWHKHYISLFTKEEVGYSGKIIKLHWYKGNNEGFTTSNGSFKIYLKETTLTTIPSVVGTFNAELAGATLVYESTTQNLPLQTGWTEFAFNTDTFNYSGNQHLMVLTMWFPPPAATGTVVWQYTTEPGKAQAWEGNTNPPTLTTGANLRGNIKITFLKPDYPTDAAIATLISPGFSLAPPVIQPVTIKIRNHGVDTLFKTGIEWSLNGVPKTSYLWTGWLTEDMFSNPVTIDSVILPFGVNRIKLWTSQPNDTTDLNPTNDTLSAIICPGSLIGNYTVGSGGVFASPELAIEALVECGISGPVSFSLLPGTYSGQWSIPLIAGVNSSKTITFRSATGNSSDVILLRDSTALQNYTWNFSDAMYVVLKNITFKSTDPANGNVIVFSGNSRYITIDSCRIEAPLGTTTTSAPVYSNNCPGYNNTVSNSVLTGGYYGVYYYGQSSYRKTRLNLTNNDITDFWNYGFVSSYADSMMIIGNRFVNRQGATDFYGVSMQQTSGHSTISRNRIIYNETGNSYGIHIQSNQSVASSFILVSNNFISLKCNAGKTTYGLNPWAATTLNYYSNSIHLYGTGSANSRCVMLSNGSSLNFMNNIFSNTAGGFAFYTNSYSYVANSNNNNFYTNSSNFIKWGATSVATLAAYKTLSGKDAASQSIEPVFVSDLDLALTNRNLSGRGAVLSVVPDDIFGNPRTPYPTIGAHEVPLLPYDAGISAINSPTPQAVIYHGDMVPVSVQLTNFGYMVLVGCDVKYTVNNGTPVTTTWSGQLQMLQSVTISLPAFASPYDTTTLCVYTSFQGDTGNGNDTICGSYYGRPVIDAALTRIKSPLNGCGIAQDSVKVMVGNKGIVPINTPFAISYQVVGDTSVITQQVSNVVIPVNDSAEVTFTTPVNLSTPIDSIFRFTAWVNLPGDLNTLNDTARREAQITPNALLPGISDTTIFFGTQMTFNLQTNDSIYWYDSDTSTAWIAKGKTFTTPILFDTTTYWAEAVPGPSFSSSPFVITEICQFRSTTGQPINGWPAWLVADDYVEISGIPGSDLGGITLEQWTTSLLSTYTFPPGTLISPWGTAVIATGSLATSTPSPFNYYYHGNGSYTSGLLSTHASGRILRDTNGAIIDAVGFNGYTFLPASGVTSVHWSGTVAGANAGIRLDGMYSRSASAWIQATNTSRQDPNEFNSGVAFPGDQICPSGRVSATVNIAGIPPYDIGISEVGTPSGCALQMEPVTIEVFNCGIDTLKGGLLASYRINNDPWQPYEAIPDTLAPGDTITYTFSTLANLAAPLMHDTVYRIKAFIKAPLDVYLVNDTIVADSIVSLRSSPAPVVSPQTTTIPYGSSTTIHASSGIPVEWFPNDTTNIPVHSGKSFVTPSLTDTTVYWAKAIGLATPPAVITPSTQTSVYTAIHTRGFYFQAPVNMIITELRAPTTLSAGPQYIQVVKFPAVPLTFPNAGPNVTLGYFPNIPFGSVQPTEIYLQAGDYIGILGGTAQVSTNGSLTGQMHSSYNNSASATINIGGMYNILAMRIGYQNTIIAGPAPSGSIHAGGGSNLGRIEMKYIIPGSGCGSPRVPVQINVQGQLSCDISTIGITNPVSSVFLGASEQVTVRLVNLGSTAQSNFLVSYRMDNKPPVHELFTGILLPNDSLEFTFQTPADFSIPGSLVHISSWINCSCDQNHWNDTIKTAVWNISDYCLSAATDTANQDISSVSLHTLSNQSAPNGNTYTDFTKTVPPPVLIPGQAYPISVISAFVPPNSTQNNCYVKAWIDFNRDGVFDPVVELVLSQPIQSYQIVNSNITIPLNARTGNTLMRVVLHQTTLQANVLPCGNYPFGETEDYTVTILPVVSKDAAIVSVIDPAEFVVSGAPSPARIRVMNTGSTNINAGELLASYTLNAGNPVYAYFLNSIPPGESDTLVLPDFVPAVGENVLHFKIALSGDSLVFNNQMAKYFFGELHATVPFYDDFETTNSWYKPGNSNKWQFGQPSGSVVNAAYSGTNAWCLNIESITQVTLTEYLYTPVFDFSSLSLTDQVELSFQHYRYSTYLGQHAQVHYSLDNGQSWITLGNSWNSNWYNLSSYGVYMFNNTGSNWEKKFISLSPSVFNGHPSVRFRFYSKTDAAVGYHGWFIDNFRLSIAAAPNDVGISEITLPITDTLPGVTLYPTVRIVNYGPTVFQTIPVSYSLNGVIVASENWSGLLSGSDTTYYTFNTGFAVPSQLYQLCAKTILAVDTVLHNDEKCSYFNISQVVSDMGVTHILYPISDPTDQLCYYNPQTQPWYAYDVMIRVMNFGLLPQSGFPLIYSFDGGATSMSENWSGTIPNGSFTDIQLSAKFQPVPGPQQLCVKVDMQGDMVLSNNELCRSYIGVECIGIEEGKKALFSLDQNAPNPAIDLTSIMFSVPSEGKIHFQLFNISGVRLYSEFRWVEPGSHQMPLSTASLSAGVYVYCVEFEGQRLWRKMIVAH